VADPGFDLREGVGVGGGEKIIESAEG